MKRRVGSGAAATDGRSRIRRRNRGRGWGYRLVVESLEGRCLLDASPPSIVVGRTLSSYTIGGVQDQQETITYTVYNPQADPETGVFLGTTLAPGVTFLSASAPTDRSGQDL